MMIKSNLFPKAYKEVLEILKYVPKEHYERIPREILAAFEKEKDINYEYKVTKFEDFNEQEMLYETKAILAVIYREYWTNAEQKKKIREIEQLQRMILEQEKINKYKSNKQ